VVCPSTAMTVTVPPEMATAASCQYGVVNAVVLVGIVTVSTVVVRYAKFGAGAGAGAGAGVEAVAVARATFVPVVAPEAPHAIPDTESGSDNGGRKSDPEFTHKGSPLALGAEDLLRLAARCSFIPGDEGCANRSSRV
jgi:hypothetical protein